MNEKANILLLEDMATLTKERTKEHAKSNLYFITDSIRIYNDDILKIHSIPNSSIDLMVTSPPYNLDIKYNIMENPMLQKKNF